MRSPDAQPLAALELWTTWGRGGPHPWPVSRRSRHQQLLQVYEQPAFRALWVERAVSPQQVDASLAWQVAFDGLIVPVHHEAHPLAFLRPIELDELDCAALDEEDLLQCDGLQFTQRRDQVLQQLRATRREKVTLAWRRALLAVLDTYPPAGAWSLHERARQEAALLRRLRISRMRYEELHRLLDVFDRQQELLCRGEEPQDDQPVLRLISHGEDRMLRELRAGGARRRAQLRQLLDATP